MGAERELACIVVRRPPLSIQFADDGREKLVSTCTSEPNRRRELRSADPQRRCSLRLAGSCVRGQCSRVMELCRPRASSISRRPRDSRRCRVPSSSINAGRSGTPNPCRDEQPVRRACADASGSERDDREQCVPRDHRRAGPGLSDVAKTATVERCALPPGHGGKHREAKKLYLLRNQRIGQFGCRAGDGAHNALRPPTCVQYAGPMVLPGLERCCEHGY